jgi:DNA polymerase IV
MCSMHNGGGDASILHADLDSFYASVEQRDDPALRGEPVIVGSGVVLAASYEAKAFGVKTAMTSRQAKQLCPPAIVVAPRFEAYSQASRDVFEVFDDTTPLVEPMSIDEAFLDVSGLRRIAGSPEEIGHALRASVLARVGLPITVGVARTKFLAKVASAVAKPDGLLVVPPDGETAFLHPLPVQRLWGVGPVTAEKLRHRGLLTVGEVALLDEELLVGLLGKAAGHHIHALAHLRDPRPVETGRRRRSVGSQQALGRGHKEPDEIRALLYGIVDRVMRRLRSGSRLCRTVVLRLRFDDFTRATRSRTLQWATDATDPVHYLAGQLLDEAMAAIAESGLTLIGISVTNLTDASAVQLTLPFEPRSGPTRDTSLLDAALDDLSQRFGTNSVKRASLLAHRMAPEMPKLPD